MSEEPSEHQFVVMLDEDLRDWRPGLESLPHDPVRRLAERIVRECGSTSPCSTSGSSSPTSSGARCAASSTNRCSTRPTSSDAKGGEPIVSNGIASCAILAFTNREFAWLEWRFLGNVEEAFTTNKRRLKWKARFLTASMTLLMATMVMLGGYAVPTIIGGS